MNSQQQPRVVLTGIIGSGKTTLFNKICKTSQLVRPGGQSVTQEIFSKSSAYGNGFNVLDTPGFGSNSRKVAHACSLMCALSEGPLNQIMLVAKAERTDVMKNYLRPLINQPYRRFKNLVTVIVTHWDTITIKQTNQYSEQIKQEIIQMLKSLNVHSTMFISIYDTGKEICLQIDEIIKKNKSQDVRLTETEFYANFDLIEQTDELEESLSMAKGEVTVKFERIAKSIRKFIADFDEKNPIMPELMHHLTIEIKKFANQTIQQFEQENNKLFSQLYEQVDDVNVAYLVDIELKKELMNQVNVLLELAQKKMKIASNHCYNYIKQCPFCGIVWFKVSGCNGETTCGNFPNSDDPQFQSQTIPQRFKFKFTENKLEFEDLGKNQYIFHSPFLRNHYLLSDFEGEKKARLKYEQIMLLMEQRRYHDPGKKRIGCGQKITWSEIPPLEPEIVKELFDPGVLDYLAEEVSKADLQLKLKHNLKEVVEEQMKQTKIIEL